MTNELSIPATTQTTSTSESAVSGATGLSSAQTESIRQIYRKAQPKNRALLDEVVFILRERLASKQIKIHQLESRLKDEEALVLKCAKKGIVDCSTVTDAIGARIVCLFRSDMDKIDQVIRENFDVSDVDNKIQNANSPLGYISIHYICKMPNRYSGPRYEGTTGVSFEIQVRTLCMHCWAAVSHYVDYKGEWDVPAELQQGLSALSGLFYVADQQFEQFNRERLLSRQRAEQITHTSAVQEVNLDTLSAYIKTQFPDRKLDMDDVSRLVLQVKEAGYKIISEIDRDVRRMKDKFQEDEAASPPSPSGRFTGAGVIRISLSFANPAFDKIRRTPKETKKDANSAGGAP